MDKLDKLMESLSDIYTDNVQLMLAGLLRQSYSYRQLMDDQGFTKTTIDDFIKRHHDKLYFGKSTTEFEKDRPMTLNQKGLKPFTKMESENMGGPTIDLCEMALLVRLVIDKDVSIKDAVKKFDFKHSAASRFVKKARDGDFDYQKYLPAEIEQEPEPEIEPPPENESEDRSIFAVAEIS